MYERKSQILKIRQTSIDKKPQVTTFSNASYPTNTSAPEWSITWQYPRGPPTSPVHAFPNIKMDSDVFPIQVSNVAAIDFQTVWAYGVGEEKPNTTDPAQLAAIDLDANVAIDMCTFQSLGAEL